MPPEPRVGAELAGYRLESLISRGGMAVVYLAEHTRMGRRVALKILAVELSEDDVFRERFVRESRVIARLHHPNIVPVFDWGEADGLLYIAMQYVEGSDLRQLLTKEGPLSPERAVSIVERTGAALDAAHRRELVHRDVKPANILVVPPLTPDEGDHVYLSDFGLTKHITSTSGLTFSGAFVGTIDYVAPEQIEDGTVDARTDIYSLGCVLYECLTGTPPFTRDNPGGVLWAHLHEKPPQVTDRRGGAPTEMDAAIWKAMAKSPDDRYASCHDLAVAARRAMSGGHTSHRTEPSTATSTGGGSRLRGDGDQSSEEAGGNKTKERSGTGRTKLAAMAAATFLAGTAAGWVAFALTDHGGGSAGGHGMRSGLSGSVYDEIVLPHIPEHMQSSCRETRQPTEVLAGGAQATARCQTNNGDIRVSYTKIHSAPFLKTSFVQLVNRRLGVDLGSRPTAKLGDCRADNNVWSYWHAGSSVRDGSHEVELTTRSGGRAPLAAPGRVVCYSQGAKTFMVWTDRRTQIFGVAETASDKGGLPTLITWWQSEAGPLSNPLKHGAM